MLDFYHFALVCLFHIQDNDSRVRVPLLLPFESVSCRTRETALLVRESVRLLFAASDFRLAIQVVQILGGAHRRTLRGHVDQRHPWALFARPRFGGGTSRCAGGAAPITSRLSNETHDSMEDVLPRWHP
jgi:hypothetical protein